MPWLRDHHHAASDHGNVEDGGVDMHRHPLDEGLCQERAGDGDAADQEREGEHLRGDGAGEAEHRDLDEPGAEGDHRVGCDHGGAFEARGHQEREQDHARARGASDQHAVADGAYR